MCSIPGNSFTAQTASNRKEATAASTNPPASLARMAAPPHLWVLQGMAVVARGFSFYLARLCNQDPTLFTL